jgi:hypothetical protein
MVVAVAGFEELVVEVVLDRRALTFVERIVDRRRARAIGGVPEFLAEPLEEVRIPVDIAPIRSARNRRSALLRAAWMLRTSDGRPQSTSAIGSGSSSSSCAATIAEHHKTLRGCTDSCDVL